MEILGNIQMWIHPVVALFLFIFSAAMLRVNGSVFFIVAFGINFLNSLLWSILPILISSLNRTSIEFYKYYGIIALILYMLSSIFFIIGIAFLAKIRSEKKLQL
jgi:hypothetical protein